MNENTPHKDDPFDFNIGSMVESESQVIGWLIYQALRWFFLSVSALTTGAFFYVYAGDAFSDFFGTASPFVAAGVGVGALDIASQFWAYMRAHRANSIRQMAIARLMSWADLLASVIVTVLFLALRSAFDVGVTDELGNLTNLGYTLNVAGVLIMIGSIAGNFMAYHFFNDSDSSNKAAVQNATLSATVAEGRYQLEAARVNSVIEETMRRVFANLSAVSREMGSRNSAEYYQRFFGDVGRDVLDLPATYLSEESDARPAPLLEPGDDEPAGFKDRVINFFLDNFGSGDELADVGMPTDETNANSQNFINGRPEGGRDDVYTQTADGRWLIDRSRETMADPLIDGGRWSQSIMAYRLDDLSRESQQIIKSYRPDNPRTALNYMKTQGVVPADLELEIFERMLDEAHGELSRPS